MKLIHETPIGKCSANAIGVGERRKSTAQKRCLVNNIVSTLKKKKKEEEKHHIFSLQDTSLFSHCHQQTATHLLAVFPCFHHCVVPAPSAPCVSAALCDCRPKQAEGPAARDPSQMLCSWRWLGWFLGDGDGVYQPLCKGTGWRLQSVVCLLLGTANGDSGFPKLPPVSGHLNSKRFVNKTMYSLHRLGSCFREHACSDMGLHLA